MRPYTNSLSAVTAGFPAEVYTPVEWRDGRETYAPIVDPGVVPGSDNDFAVLLDYSIRMQAGLTVTDTTTSTVLVIVPWSVAPNAAQVAVDYDRGKLTFHSSLEGHDISVAYTPGPTVVGADYENRIQKELAAVQQSVLGGGGSGVSWGGITGTLSAQTDLQAALDAKASLVGGKVPSSQLPALALTDVHVVADEAAQLALTAEEGDVAIRSDEAKTYIHNGGTAGTMADWSEIAAAGGGAATWGAIGGTLSDQTDLQTALNNKASTTGTASTTFGFNTAMTSSITTLEFYGGANTLKHEAGPGYSMFTFNGQVTASRYHGSGASLTTLDASNLSSGTVPNARLSSNVALKDAANTWSALQTVTGGLTTEGGRFNCRYSANEPEFRQTGGGAATINFYNGAGDRVLFQTASGFNNVAAGDAFFYSTKSGARICFQAGGTVTGSTVSMIIGNTGGYYKGRLSVGVATIPSAGAYLQTPSIDVDGTIETGTSTIGFYGATPITKPTVDLTGINTTLTKDHVIAIADVLSDFGLITYVT